MFTCASNWNVGGMGYFRHYWRRSRSGSQAWVLEQDWVEVEEAC